MARKFWVNTNRNATVTKAIKDIDKYSVSAQERIKSAIRASTADVHNGAKSRVPVKTGALKKSIDSDISKDGLSGYVFSKSPVAHLIEFGVSASYVEPQKAKALKIGEGFAAHALIPERKAKPFMRPAADSEKPNLEKRIKEAVAGKA